MPFRVPFLQYFIVQSPSYPPEPLRRAAIQYCLKYDNPDMGNDLKTRPEDIRV